MTWDAVIVGGGPAGAATAIPLAAAGRRVLLLDRRPQPHQSVCGEFLGSDAAERLAGLGLDLPRLGALPVTRLRLAAGRQEAAAALPFPAWSLGRDVLDAALLETAQGHGAVLQAGTALALQAGRVDLADRGIAAAAVVLATGKHDLRGRRRGGGGRLGFKQYWRLDPEQQRLLAGTVELHLFRGGYAGLQPAAAGRANLCLTVTPALFRRCGGWPQLLRHLGDAAPRLAARLAGGAADWPRPLAVAGLPYGFQAPEDGLYRVGDQLAVIHSLSGEGVALALDSGSRTAERLLTGQPPLPARVYRPALRLAQMAGVLAAGLPWAALAAVRLNPGLLGWLARELSLPRPV